MDTLIEKKQATSGTYEEVVLGHVDALYSFGYWLTNDADEAKDLLQETLLKAFRYFSYYEQGTNAKSWLFRIMKNNFLNDVSKKSRTPDFVDIEEAYFQLPSEASYTSLKIDELGFSDDVVLALNSISSNLKTVFLLKYIHGFRYHEIASMFQMPIGTVKIWLHQAKKQLKAHLTSVEMKKAA